MSPAQFLILVGLSTLGLGLALTLTPKIPWVGKLPGDIHIQGDRFSFHFPVTSCLLVSGLLSLLFTFLPR